MFGVGGLIIQAAGAGEEIPALAFVETKTAQDLSAADPHTWSVAMSNGSGSYRCLLLAAGNESSDTGPTLDGASYNGVAGDLEASVADSESGTSNRLHVWRWGGSSLPNDTSNHDMVVDLSASGTLAAGAVEYQGVADATAESTDTSNVDPPDDMVVTSTDGALVFHAFNGSVNGRVVTEDNSQNQRVELGASTASITLWIGDLIGVSAGSVTSGITLDSSVPRSAQVCISLAKAA